MSLPPDWFVRSLASFDSDLSVRWGERIKQWVIERKAYVPPQEIEFLQKRKARAKATYNSPPEGMRVRDREKTGELWLGLNEELASARLGRRVIMFVKTLSPALFDVLAAADMRRYGGYARFADEIERREEFKERDADRQLDNKRHAYNLEVADMMHHIWNKQDAKLHAGEKDMRRLLGQPESDEPLISLTDI